MIDDLVQAWPLPSAPRPIVCLGAGGIVRCAHLLAYAHVKLPVRGLFDVRPEVARETAGLFGVRDVYRSLEEAVEDPGAVFDVAVPPDQVLGVLEHLPDGASVLIQKPLGRDLDEALRIRALCRAKGLRAAVNFQLRFSPNVLALRDAIERGLLGAVRDVEVRVSTQTPWSTWSFLEGAPRLEVLYHSIHYLDLLRAMLGEPESVHCCAVPEPQHMGRYSDARSTSLLCYPGALRCTIHTNHAHSFGRARAVSELKVEGTAGAAVARMGVNLDYPRGLPDTLELTREGEPWHEVPLRGSWFPEAFEGTMSNLQRHAAGEDEALPTSVEDAVRTMALVEACYESARAGGVRPRTV